MFVSLDDVGVKRVPLEDTSRALFADLGLDYPGGASKGRGWSSQQTLQTCPHLFKRTYVDGVRSGSKAMDVGSMVHLALAVRHLRMMDPSYPLTTAMLFEHMLARTDSHGKEILEARRLMEAYESNYEYDYYDRILSVEESYTSPTGDSCRWDYIAEVNASSGLFPGIYVSDAKCVHGDTIITNYIDGQRTTVREMAAQGVAPHVLSYNGDLRLSAASVPVSNGVKEVLGVKLTSGRKITTSLNHPFLTARGWVRAENLTQDDWVAIPRTTAGVTTSAFSDAEVKIAGYLIGDGYIGQSKMSFTQTNKDVMQDFRDAVTAIGSTCQDDIQIDRAPFVRLSSNPLDPVRALILRLDLQGKVARQKLIPAELHEISDRQVGILIGALWDTDGTINVVRERKVKTKTTTHVNLVYTSMSEQLCRDIQTLLLRLGLNSTVKESRIKYRGEFKPVFHTTVVGRDSKRHFMTMIEDGTIPFRKYAVTDAKAAVQPRDDRKIPKDRILASIRLDEMPAIMRLHVKSCRAMNAFALAGEAELPDCPTHVKTAIAQILAEPLWWDRVDGTPLVEGYAETFDITVPETSTFVANDIITHNTASRFDAAATDGWSNNGELLGEMMHYIDGGFEQKYGPLRGLIVDIIGKQKDPQFMRIVLPVNMKLLDQHRIELRKWNAMRDFYAAADFWPRARGNCIGQYGKCQRYDECADLAG